MTGHEAQVIVVGGGTAGCVVATRLAQRGRSVLLLEAGGRYRPLVLDPPLPSQKLRPLFSWRFRTAKQPALGGRRITLPLGRVLGGSSSINAMMYCPGSSSDYDRWGDLGNEGWSSVTVGRLYRRLEDRTGQGGVFAVSSPRFRSRFSEAVVAAGAELDLDLDFFDVSQRKGRRSSSASAYLPLGRATGRLEVLTGALATRIIIEGGRATGVEFRHRGRVERASAGDEVVVSAGAVKSPHLLMLSGIGPAAHLAEHGLATVMDLPGVGANLQDHVRAPLLYEREGPGPGDPRYWVPAAADYLVRRRGVFTSNCCDAGGFVRSHPSLPTPDIQFVTHFSHPASKRVVDLEVCLLEPRSRGSVRLRSPRPEDPPLVHPNYLSHGDDLAPLLRGLRLGRTLARTRALANLPLGREVWPGPEASTDAELVQYLRGVVETCYHLAGTCRMGNGDNGVVDSRLRVHGIDGLRVADASIIPELIHGNTQAPALMIGEMAADFMTPEPHSGAEPGDLEQPPYTL